MSYRLLLLLLFLGACGGPPRPGMPPEPGRVDAPYELENDEDLADTRLLFDAMQGDKPLRNKMRVSLAKEYARRIRTNLESQNRDIAFENFEHLVTLWRPDELSAGADGLARFSADLQALRKNFSRSGGAKEAIATLEVLSLLHPTKSPSYQQEINVILAYSDELAIAKHGGDALRARPITILESVSQSVATKSIVDRLIELYRARQLAIQSAFRRQGASFELLQIHGQGALQSAHNIVLFNIQSGRLREALAAIETISGIGDDTNLRDILRRVATSKNAAPWIELSLEFQANQVERQVALSICQLAVDTYPEDAPAAIAAADAAKLLGNPHLAIRHYEQGLTLDPKNQQASESLATMYEGQVARFSFAGRPTAALKEMLRLEAFHAKASKDLDKPLSPDLSSAYAAMARGLVSLGELQAARGYLKRSLSLRPNLSALELLGTLSQRLGNHKLAETYFRRAIAIDTEEFADSFNQLRLRRLLAESQSDSEHLDSAIQVRNQALVEWARLLKQYDLGKQARAEALIEIGKLEFERGKREIAIGFFFQALSAGLDNTNNHADLVAFLITKNSYEYALDVYLDALGSRTVSTYFKTYMSLWILAESYRLGLGPESHAIQFLKGLRGDLWSAQLARYAVTAKNTDKLKTMATTRGRRAEFLYYSAVIGPKRGDPEVVKILLEEVIRGSMVLFFEFEMAKHRLRQ